MCDFPDLTTGENSKITSQKDDLEEKTLNMVPILPSQIKKYNMKMIYGK